MELPEQIESERIILKYSDPTFELAKRLFEIVEKSRETLREWLPWVDKVNSIEDEFTGFLMHVQKKRKEKTGFGYVIFHKETDEILGCVDLIDINDTNKTAEIGFWLSNDAVGHGYMKEAVLALESEAFKAGINRIAIRNDVENVRSANVAKKANYVLEAVIRQDCWDDYHKSFRDTNVWSKLFSEWKTQQRG